MTNPTDSVKLSRCPTPWCDVPEDERYVWQGPTDAYSVICGGCQVEGPFADTEAEAIAAWNLRSTDDLLEALEGLVRYAEAVRMAAGMGKNQLACLEAARTAIARHRGTV